MVPLVLADRLEDLRSAGKRVVFNEHLPHLPQTLNRQSCQQVHLSSFNIDLHKIHRAVEMCRQIARLNPVDALRSE